MGCVSGRQAPEHRKVGERPLTSNLDDRKGPFAVTQLAPKRPVVVAGHGARTIRNTRLPTQRTSSVTSINCCLTSHLAAFGRAAWRIRLNIDDVGYLHIGTNVGLVVDSFDPEPEQAQEL